MTSTLSAVRATSGTLRRVVDPPLAPVAIPRCQMGIGYEVLMPPPLPMPFSGFHTVSDTYGPTGPVVVKVVPPTLVRYGSSAGKLVDVDVINASLSPEATK